MICVPIVGPSMQKALQDIPIAEDLADIIELRLDLIAEPDLKALLQAVSKPVIVTNRTKLEGGQFKGSEEERVRALQEAIAQGVDYVDIEACTQKELLKPILENSRETKIILSYHDFSKTVEDLNPLYEIMSELPADVLKIVTYAQDINDNIKMFELLKRAKQDRRPLVAFCMGEKGEVSRILSPLYGGFLTFGAMDTGKESAPGQILASTLKDIYRLGMERKGFKVFGVIGNPIAKSMGYLIHNRAFDATQSTHIYLPFLVANVGKFFPEFAEYFSGLSVTMPFKEDIIAVLDRVDETAKKIGAVNTVVKEQEGWVGYNTDCTGAIQALEVRTDLQDKKVLIIGSGGTARAIAYGVKEKGGCLTVTYHSNKERSQALAKELGCEAISIRDIGGRDIDVLINCSPVGMNPNENETPCSSQHFHKGMIVFDAVYNPPETRLLKEARAAGCEVISGVELFINQAAAQFELWTGGQAPVDAMRETLMKKIQPE